MVQGCWVVKSDILYPKVRLESFVCVRVCFPATGFGAEGNRPP